MRIFRTLGLAAGLAMAGSAAFAWGDMYMGDATNDPNSNFLMHSYDGPNACPAGLQPVLVGGVVCCGTPNAGPYIDRAGKTYRAPAARAYSPRAYAPAGEKGVVYR